jgi:phosphoglycolate phosphatase-like HAD superfamily hydrolase
MSLSGVILDLDGTIAESHPMAIQLIGNAIAQHGARDLTPEEVVALFGPNEQGIFRAAVGDEHWEAAWETYLADYSARHDLCPEPFPGIKELLRRLHDCGSRLGLVSGKTETTVGISLEVFGIDHLFSAVEGGAMDGVVKAEAIDRILNAWDLDATEVAYVGDTALDVRESKRAGVTAVAAAWSAFTDRSLLEPEAPDALFESVDEFADWIVEQACAGG